MLANNLVAGATSFANSTVAVSGRFSVAFGNSAVDYVVLRDRADATVDSVRWTSGVNPDALVFASFAALVGFAVLAGLLLRAAAAVEAEPEVPPARVV